MANLITQRAIRSRVRRMLEGDINPHDVDLLFTALRFHPGVHPYVAELGHFAAHRDEKDRGEISDGGGRLFEDLRAHIEAGSGFYSRPVLSDQTLTSSLARSLVQGGLFSEGDLEEIGVLTPALGQFAVATLHGAWVKFADGTSAPLLLRYGPGDLLEISATVQIEKSKAVGVNLALFVTSLNKSVCEGRLLSEFPVADPTLTIERTQRGTLRYLE